MAVAGGRSGGGSRPPLWNRKDRYVRRPRFRRALGLSALIAGALAMTFASAPAAFATASTDVIMAGGSDTTMNFMASYFATSQALGVSSNLVNVLAGG